jgi:hypothetical protein
MSREIPFNYELHVQENKLEISSRYSLYKSVKRTALKLSCLTKKCLTVQRALDFVRRS